MYYTVGISNLVITFPQIDGLHKKGMHKCLEEVLLCSNVSLVADVSVHVFTTLDNLYT